MAADEYEVLRETFRPQITRVLFVGESRPIGGTFFYRGDSTLEQHTQQAFEFVGSASAFLEHFTASKCYLVDLCVEPVNAIVPTERRANCRSGEARLATELHALQPEVVIVVMKGIAPHVRRAIANAGLEQLAVYVLPFPAMGHQPQYVQGLRTILGELRASGVLPGP